MKEKKQKKGKEEREGEGRREGRKEGGGEGRRRKEIPHLLSDHLYIS